MTDKKKAAHRIEVLAGAEQTLWARRRLNLVGLGSLNIQVVIDTIKYHATCRA